MLSDIQPGKKKGDPVEDMYKVYNASVQKQGGDYDDIMDRFKKIYGESGPGMEGSGRYGFNPYTAAQTRYDKSPDTTAALSNLNELSRTGGLDDAAQQNLRARGMSPIRSMYATASRDMDRNRRLSGGYSPNFGAATAKMTRDQSSLIADQMDKVNGTIAEMVQSGRLSAAPNYASAAQAESQLKHNVGMDNTQATNEASKFNAQGMFESQRQRRGDRLGAAQGMSNLYGTTPALSKLYGDQAMDTARFTQNTNQQKKQNAIDLFGKSYSGRGYGG